MISALRIAGNMLVVMLVTFWWFVVEGDHIHNHIQVQGPFPDVAMCRLTNLQFQYWIGQGITQVGPCTSTQPTTEKEKHHAERSGRNQ
jgi:hypothetical protein